MAGLIDRGVASALAVIRWLALPIAALLFLQWPLREFVHAYSREANDLGQWLFAIFVAASVVAATRAEAHLASDAVSHRYSLSTRRRVAACGVIVALLPWALFVLWSAWAMLRASARGWERFPDTGNFGYFILKLALALLMGLIVLQAIVDLVQGGRRK